ncbi:hypothetical protein PAXRUDRAFT_360206 [Paxillus rubicundulus Ve08.2h10]|uniref:Uncharacterized protein n=1 Tax=Paxillus rubicundulus Ve08.2h10 TaxID=930991 RepID=A0A0D0DMR0_9AGAM|nr:hypothetical protein PAXRUDRAFT_360206 [Paxillus rubicundulus Ve08.2h10]
MSCTPTPTATQYATITTFTTSTSYSQSAAPQLTTVVQQACVASGTISGSSMGCISSAQIAEVNTVGGSGQGAQIPIVVTVPIIETTPTATLFATDCTNGETQPTPSTPLAQSFSVATLTTSVLVESTPPPSTMVETSATTLGDGSVVQTVVTVVSTLPVTSIYAPTTVPNPSLQSNASQGSGTNVAPIVGGVLGGFFGLIAIVGSLWWLCRRRRSWDDIFEKEDVQDDDPWATPIAVHRERDRARLDLSAEPKPYQYGLVGHIAAPAASGSPPSSPRLSGYDRMSLPTVHSRHTSFSVVPLLQGSSGRSSRPSTAGSAHTVPTQPTHRVLGSATMGPRSLSVLSQSTSSTAPLIDTRSRGSLIAPSLNAEELEVFHPLNRTGTPAVASERRVWQIQ